MDSDELLFPVSGMIPAGIERKTSKMMSRDLERARRTWIDEASSDEEREQWERSDFLTYCDASGRDADFHPNRHTFITGLEHAGISPRTAQSLPQHSDIRLTMGVYTHIGLRDQVTAIEFLPGPPKLHQERKNPPRP